ncbi:MAG: pirin family protein [Propionibacteriales bacterium]|nr:pirin family protein [Propionibacteriales bacterium]
MSNAEADLEVESTGRDTVTCVQGVDVLEPRPVLLGPRQEVRRVLPHRDRRMIGAWCFVDHYGPEDIAGRPGMRVPPHPHTGLQTVSWLLEGEVHHRDSLDSDVDVIPGQLNLMTAGTGVAHSEESPAGHTAVLHGLQLWVALPGNALHEPRAFAQYRDLPVIERAGLRATVVMGDLEGVASPAATFTPIVGAELVVDGEVSLRVRPDFEYGVLAIDAGLVVQRQRVEMSEIAYVGGDLDTIELSSDGPRRAFLLGGAPFDEDIVMWWNFLGRSHDEIVEARRVWNDEVTRYQTLDESGDSGSLGGRLRFGIVRGFDGDPLLAPPMPTTRLKARGRHADRF